MFNVVNIIPTGIGANIGGFAGDANPVNSVLETFCDLVITHPNAVNAANLYAATSKTLYVEGFALDNFLSGNLGLKKSYNKIGVIIDKKAEPQITHIINALNACISVYGADISGFLLTDEEIGARVVKDSGNLFNGVVTNKEAMFKAAEKLISEGANTLAVFTVLENPYEDAENIYLAGKGVDPIGRLEALISHMLVEETGVPCAHAPVFLDDYERTVSDPRVAAEEIGFTYIPCVIRGLQFAPRFIQPESIFSGCITLSDINALVCPFSCVGANWMQTVLQKNIPVIAVKENTTFINDIPEKFGLEEKIIIAENYLEAIGILLSLKAGLSYKSLRRPLSGIKRVF